MSSKDCPHLEIDILPESIESDFLKVLEIIRPEWDNSKVEFKLSEKDVNRGLMNTMVKCYNKDSPTDAIMIRVHNVQMNQFLTRSTEVTCIKQLNHANCAPNILATFKTGFCYEFIPGEILNHHRLGDEPIWRLIAEKLAKIHSVTVLDGEALNGQNQYLRHLDMMLNAYPDELPDPVDNHRLKTELPNKETLVKELMIAKEGLSELNSPVVLCHNDTRAENIIWQEDKEAIHFVDFEAMNYSYQGAELANHFARFAGFAFDMSLFPSEDFQMRWLNVYLRKYYESKGFNPDDVTPTDVRKLYVQVRKFFLFQLISAGMAGPVMAKKTLVDIDFKQLDIMLFSINHVKEYFNRKEEILELKMPECD